MKKLLLFASVLMLFAGQMSAAPVDVNTAKELGAKYLKNNVLSARGITAVEHVYTLNSDNGTPYLYVFNHENGYVVVAADDRAYPILGYSDGEPFDVNNIPEGLKYYLGHYGRQIQYAIDNEFIAEADVVEQWELLRKEGITMRTRMEKAVTPLLTTTWNQDYPYNYYAPASSSYWAPGGRCYAGCVACAMSQCMKFWNWPETGVGEHSYSTSSTGGTLSANFGETTYNWGIMPNSLGSQANNAALAVALLMYHCGISVDMNYAANGSGAHTEDVADALIEYFRYGTGAHMEARDSYDRTRWEDMLIASFDKGIPVVYAGQDTDGGHAFNCDGYNDQRYFHFNWGWSGSYNNYYQIDALNTGGNGSYNTSQRVVFDIIPDYIYNTLVPAIETLDVEVENSITKNVHISWTLPEESVNGEPLTSIDVLTLRRNGEVIQSYSNPQPGAVMTFDDNVSEYGAYNYTIGAKNNNIEYKVFTKSVIVGPNCQWKVVGQTTSFQGWNEGKMQFVGANGAVFNEVTMTSSQALSEKIAVPEGNFSLKWVAPLSTVASLTITLKNSAGQTVYTFTGSSTQLSGTVFNGNNDCPNCTPPTALAGENIFQEGHSVAHLTWESTYAPSKFKIYRSADGVEYTEVGNVGGDVREYFDPMENGTYYYRVTAYSSACESTPALTPDNEEYVAVTVTAVQENSINARIYPNPTNGVLRVEAEALNSVAVYNLVGQKVYEENVDGNECVVNMKEFGSGIYMVRINAANGSTTQKVSVIE